MSAVAIASALLAATAQPYEPVPAPVAPPPERTEAPTQSRFYGRIGGVAAFYHPSARVALGGQDVPNSQVAITTDTGVTFDIGYDLGDRFSIQFMFGLPPGPSITGERAIAALGELGQVRYGALILTGLFRLPRVGPVRPYAGLGPAYAVIVRAHDGSVVNLKVHNDWGFALQAGAEVPVSRRLALFADVKKLFLSVSADGSIAGGVPVDARIALDPVLVSAGLKIRF